MRACKCLWMELPQLFYYRLPVPMLILAQFSCLRFLLNNSSSIATWCFPEPGLSLWAIAIATSESSVAALVHLNSSRSRRIEDVGILASRSPSQYLCMSLKVVTDKMLFVPCWTYRKSIFFTANMYSILRTATIVVYWCCCFRGNSDESESHRKQQSNLST